SIAPPEHWALADCIAVVDDAHKEVGSTRGHELATTSPLQAARVEDAPRRLALCRQAILQRDFDALAEIAEMDSNLMHAVMMTSTPPLFYWAPTTLTLMRTVRDWRHQGEAVFYSVDAGPNVHVICPLGAQERIAERLRDIPGVKTVLTATVGGPARLVAEEQLSV
ncbi:MAG: diphosphomevalonate decarboxylase, partial [Anaerolineae bacterium]